MHLILDGHNLIPKIPGMRLSNLDDEMELIRMLQVYCRLHHDTATVFFDGAPANQAGTRRYHPVTAVFVRLGQTADDAIASHLHTLGKRAKNITVISSDRRVQNDARAMHAAVISSDVFAGKLIEGIRTAPPTHAGKDESNPDIDEWLRLFNEGRKNDPPD